VASSQPEFRVPDSELDFDGELIYRWRGELFTGTGYEESSDGSLSEISYRYGMQDGPARDWYPGGILKGESNFRENTLHGLSCEYAEDGTLVRETSYEYGMAVKKREKNSRGEIVTAFTLTADNQAYGLLERYRREKGWPPAR
jgi:antitoxin component YwqK of YwqJK toxin-antitoxin module